MSYESGDCQVHGLSTDRLAKAIDAKPGSIRVRLCQTGSYFGLKPRKLPNGRLLWPSDSVSRLFGTEDTVNDQA